MSTCKWLPGLMLIAAVATSQQAVTPSIVFTELPAWGTGAPIRGQVTGVPFADYRVAVLIFVPDAGWYSKPLCSQQLTGIAPDGSWLTTSSAVSEDRHATMFAAYLVPATHQPVCVTGPAQIPPSLETASIAHALIRRTDPNPRTIQFSGITWRVKSTDYPMSPGPNQFSASNAWVDDAGRLHLRIARCGLNWCSAEISTMDEVGYGTYRVSYDSPVTPLDPNVVAGMFTWSYEGEHYNRELDVEFARWGNASAAFNAQYVVQPYTVDNHIRRFAMASQPSSTHTITWSPDQVAFRSTAGLSGTGGLLQEWSFTKPAEIPPPGRTQFHLNFYLQGGLAPTNQAPQEIVIWRFEYAPSGSGLSISPAAATIAAAGGTATASVTASGPGCVWSAESHAPWLQVETQPETNTTSSLVIRALTNSLTPRFADVSITSTNCTITPGQQRITISQLGVIPCQFNLSALSTVVQSAGGELALTVSSTGAMCPWSTSSATNWVTIQQPLSRLGTDVVRFTVAPNPSTLPRSTQVSVAGYAYTITQQGTAPVQGLRFTPKTPCRVADTRYPAGIFGGPSVPALGSRDFPVPLSNCNIPANARAYSLNVTAVPAGPLAFISLWPTGQSQPLVSTLNAFRGQVVANAAIVPAGAGGAVSVYASDATDVVLDINGYFSESTAPEALSFYPLTPCRLVDTRQVSGTFGPFGQPSLSSDAPVRDFPLRAGGCGIPSTAQAYALNFTVVPKGTLNYLSTWPARDLRPLVSTLNSWDGRILANAAIVPAGAGGAISVYADLPPNGVTDLVIDINGYFAPPSGAGLQFYPATPCRLVDTRDSRDQRGNFGAPPLTTGVSRTFETISGPCSLPATTRALSLNATVVPAGSLAFLTLWPPYTTQPLVSTLNSFGGDVVANAAIVPVAPPVGLLSSYALLYQAPTTDLILDINGYFAP